MTDSEQFAQLLREYQWAWDNMEHADASQFEAANSALSQAISALNSYIHEFKTDRRRTVSSSRDGRSHSSSRLGLFARFVHHRRRDDSY